MLHSQLNLENINIISNLHNFKTVLSGQDVSKQLQALLYCVYACVYVCLRVYISVQHENIFHLQMTSVKMGADQLVPCVYHGIGLLHDEQQESLVNVCCFTLSNNNIDLKFLSLFHTNYSHTATSAST